jgi:hypothetical protein
MIFRRKRDDWVPETVSEASGDHGDLHVVLRNLPCLRDPATGRRSFVDKGFGWEFRGKLSAAIDPVDDAMAVLGAGGRFVATVGLARGDQVQVEITGRPGKRPRQFESDLSDALIDAFESIQLEAP